jgi:hypothetical protein
MAREITETPILRGKDAKCFCKAMENINPLIKKELEEQKMKWLNS